MDPDTGEATDDLQPQVIEMFQDLGSKCTTVSQVLKTEDKKVFNAIQQGIEYVVTVFLKKVLVNTVIQQSQYCTLFTE